LRAAAVNAAGAGWQAGYSKSMVFESAAGGDLMLVGYSTTRLG
jgi:hypothetical protein